MIKSQINGEQHFSVFVPCTEQVLSKHFGIKDKRHVFDMSLTDNIPSWEKSRTPEKPRGPAISLALSALVTQSHLAKLSGCRCFLSAN